MVDQLKSFAAEVTRVAREVDGSKAGWSGVVPGVAGTWRIARQRQLDGPQPDRFRNRRKCPTAIRAAICPVDHSGREGRNLQTEGDPSTRWTTSHGFGAK